METTKKIRRLAAVTLALYMLLLFWNIALKCNMRISILDAKIYNQRFTLAERFEMYLTRFATTDFADTIANIMFFLPLGMLIPFFAKKPTYVKTVFYSFLISLGFEVLQVINCIGAFTYIDIINNTAGAIIGAFIHLILHKRVKERPLAIAFVVHIVILIPVIIAAAINTVAHIDYYL